MVIEAGAFIVYRPPRRSLLSVTTELSYLSHSFCRSLRPMGRCKLIAGAIRVAALRDAVAQGTTDDERRYARRRRRYDTRRDRWTVSGMLGAIAAWPPQ